MKQFLLLIIIVLAFVACDQTTSQETKDAAAVDSQQSQYAASQPVPAFNWSLERHLLTQLYQLRNQKVATHSVWRSALGGIEGDCPSLGFSLPYDTSLTNPLKKVGRTVYALTTIEQAEPNGIFASKNTAATWVMCTGDAGLIEPIYVETRVTVYPYPVLVDYMTDRVIKSGEATAKLTTK